jgi:hypothetical protein
MRGMIKAKCSEDQRGNEIGAASGRAHAQPNPSDFSEKLRKFGGRYFD